MKTINLLRDIIIRCQVEKQQSLVVLDVIKHAYELECALELTFKEFPDWLGEIHTHVNNKWYQENYYLWLFRGELKYYCESMLLSEAIRTVKEEYDL